MELVRARENGIGEVHKKQEGETATISQKVLIQNTTEWML
jgi:hypothetical protein